MLNRTGENRKGESNVEGHRERLFFL